MSYVHPPVQSADNTLEDARDYFPCTPPPFPQHHPPAPALAHLHTSAQAPVLTPTEGLDVTPNSTPLKPGVDVIRHSSPIRMTVSSGTMATSFQPQAVQPPAIPPTSTSTIATGRCHPHAGARHIVHVHGPQVQPSNDPERFGMARHPGPHLPEQGTSGPPPLRKDLAEPPDSREMPERHLDLPQSQVTALNVSVGPANSQGVSATVETARSRPSQGGDGGGPHSWHSLPLKGEEGDHHDSSSLAPLKVSEYHSWWFNCLAAVKLVENFSTSLAVHILPMHLAPNSGLPCTCRKRIRPFPHLQKKIP